MLGRAPAAAYCGNISCQCHYRCSVRWVLTRDLHILHSAAAPTGRRALPWSRVCTCACVCLPHCHDCSVKASRSCAPVADGVSTLVAVTLCVGSVAPFFAPPSCGSGMQLASDDYRAATRPDLAFGLGPRRGLCLSRGDMRLPSASELAAARTWAHGAACCLSVAWPPGYARLAAEARERLCPHHAQLLVATVSRSIFDATSSRLRRELTVRGGWGVVGWEGLGARAARLRSCRLEVSSE